MDLTPEIYNKFYKPNKLSPKEAVEKVLGKKKEPGQRLTKEQRLKTIKLLNDSNLDISEDSQRLMRWFKPEFLINTINNKWLQSGAIGTGAIASQQQYRNGGLVGDPPEKKSKLVDFTDITWTDKDLEYANENLLCFDGQCLDRSLQAYDKVVASYLPGMPSSSKFKKDYGFQSAPKYEKYEDYRDKIVEKAGYEGDPSTGKISYVSVGGAKKPVSDKTQKWFESQKGFDVKSSDFTVDSWDYGGVLKDEGGKIIFTQTNKDF